MLAGAAMHAAAAEACLQRCLCPDFASCVREPHLVAHLCLCARAPSSIASFW